MEAALLINDEYKEPSFEFDDLIVPESLPSTPVNKCDIFTGDWVPNPEAPYYTNTTCWEIHEHQNCMKYGRPDTDFMKWRWKPNECELPIFNPFQFLQIMRGKSLAFVGDSIGRNHMQSMICLLSKEWETIAFLVICFRRRKLNSFGSLEYAIIRYERLGTKGSFSILEVLGGSKVSKGFCGEIVSRLRASAMHAVVEWPIDVSYTDDFSFKRWKYSSYNFTMTTFWSPYLVRAKQVDSNGGLYNVYLDEFDEKWTTQIKEFDYVIINVGQWFLRPMVFYEKQKIVGCQYCSLENVTHLSWHYGYKKAFGTTFKAIINLENFKGVTFLRTFAPSHFENGVWDKGGNCVRTKPFKSNETRLEGNNLELHTIQLEQFKIAEKEARKKGLKFMLLDTTQAMLLRPDGHPNKYGHWPHENVTLFNDCVHWCLPGPIDTWSDFLLEMLKMEDIVNDDEEFEEEEEDASASHQILDNEEELEAVARSASSDDDDNSPDEAAEDDDEDKQNNRRKGRLSYLLQQTELFAHFAKGDQSSQKKAKGRGHHASKVTEEEEDEEYLKGEKDGLANTRLVTQPSYPMQECLMVNPDEGANPTLVQMA
ncbi:hypothetical protein JHK84_052336 [Glycine max]|nr:hypothetical protein JHK85_053150 [Glycine max]KAG5082298.1 hypothetical protein JHK84_052336 [Glycine max]